MKKILSILISLLLIFSVCSVATVSAEATAAEYYVINGGTGDGKSADAPAATVNDVIATINADGLTAGDTATVYIMQKDWTSTSELTYWADSSVGRNITAYDFTLEVKPYDASTTTYLVYHNKANYNEFMVLGGPTIFDDITIVCCRNNYDPISLFGSSATFRDGVKYGTIGTSFGTTVTARTALPTALGYYMVKKTITEKLDLVFENAFVTPASDIKNMSIIIGAVGPETATYNEDVNITFDNADINAYLNWGNTSDKGGTLTFKKNLNINIKNATAIINNQWVDATVNVEGAVQFIYDDATYLSGEVTDFASVTVTGGVYKIKNESAEADLLSFTETAGVYAVKEGFTAYATDSMGNVFTSENGLLTVPAVGAYTVTDEIPEEPVDKDTNYYVINGGIGDGDTAATPAATVNQAIATAVADGFTAGDTVTVYIMQKAWTNTNELTYWADSSVGKDITAHDFTLEVKPYDASVTTYLVYHNRANYNEYMVLGGPTIFDDITIVCCRQNYDPISLFGSSATFRDGVKYGTIGTSFGTTVTARTALPTALGYYMVKKTVTEKLDLVFENEFVTPASDIKNMSIIIGAMGPETATYAEDVTFTFDNENINAYLNWGNTNSNGGTATFNKNININIKNATAITNNQFYDAAVKVDGAVQFIVDKAATVLNGSPTDFAGVTVTGGVYKLVNVSAVEELLSFTETAGTYAVKEGYTAYATDAEGKLYTSENGLLTVPAGEYTVSDEAPAEPVNYGDVNDDGEIDVRDLVRAQKLIANNAEFVPAVDIDLDGEMTSADLVKIRKVILGKE